MGGTADGGAASIAKVGIEGANDGEAELHGWRAWRYAHWQWRFIKYDNPEITGWIMSGVARGAISSWIAVFSVLALTALGQEVQDCDTKRVTIGGVSILTTSIVSIVLAIEGVVNALFSPLFGAISDSTSHRTLLFKSAFWLLALSVLACAISVFGRGSIAALLAFAGFLIVAALLYELQLLLHASYLPEIAHEDKLSVSITSKQYAVLDMFQLVFIITSVGLTLALGISRDALTSAQVGAVICVVVWGAWALPGMAMLGERHKTEESRIRAGCCGVPRVIVLVRQCWSTYGQIGLYLVGYAFYITGANALVSLATSYVLAELGLAGINFQILIGVVLLFTAPGALLITYINRWVGDLRRTNMAVISFWILILASIPVLLVGEDAAEATSDISDKCAAAGNSNAVARQPTAFSGIIVYFEAMLWGLAIGMIYPTNTALMARLVPGGQESSWFGMKTLSSKVLSFAPPLLYTVINEATEKPRLAILSILPFMVVGLVIISFLDLDKADDQIRHTLVLRHGRATAGEDVGTPLGVGDGAFAVKTTATDVESVESAEDSASSGAQEP